MLRSCVPTPQVQSFDQSVFCSWAVLACLLAAVWKRASYAEMVGAEMVVATPPETHPVPSDLGGEARSSPVSTWVGDDLVRSQE